MAALDIKDAYYNVPMLYYHQKLLRFIHCGIRYKCTVLPNGYTDGPRTFAEALKPPLSEIGRQDSTLAGYFDKLINVADTEGLCIQNIFTNKLINLLHFTGFVIHAEKSMYLQTIEYLVFWINSVSMTVSLTFAKKKDIVDIFGLALPLKMITIRFLAEILGKLSSSFIAAPLGKLFYRALERAKITAQNFI